MKKLLKAGAVILCIMLCLCSTISVFADWVELQPADTKKGEIQIKVTLDGEVTTNMRATAFRIIKVSVEDVNAGTGNDPFYQPADPVYTWAPGVADWVAKHYPTYIDTENGNAVTQTYIDYFNEDKSPAEEIVPFIDALAAAIKTHDDAITFQWNEAESKFVEGIDPLVASATFGTDKTATISNLSKGSFIVLIEGGNQIYQPSIANLTPIWRQEQDGKPAGWYVDSPVELNLKHAGVGIVKTVSDNEKGPFGVAVSSGMGDRVYFNISVDVPKYSENAVSKTFTVRDESSIGLSFTDALTIYGVSSDTETELTKETEYTVTTEAATGKFAVAFDYSKVSKYDKVRITYNTLVNEKAVTGSAGNPNTAYLDYANNPYEANSLKTINSKATVYTYGMDLTKTNKDGTSRLPGAVFTLEMQEGSEWKPILFEMDSTGVYHRVTSGGVTRVETGDNDNLGKLDLRGLDTGKYRLKEVQAPSGGYVLLKDYVELTINDAVDKDGAEGIDGIPDDGITNNPAVTSGYITKSIPNTMGFDLPLTGGMGTILFTAGGIVLVAGAVVLLLVANRKKSRRS